MLVILQYAAQNSILSNWFNLYNCLNNTTSTDLTSVVTSKLPRFKKAPEHWLSSIYLLLVSIWAQLLSYNCSVSFTPSHTHSTLSSVILPEWNQPFQQIFCWLGHFMVCVVQWFLSVTVQNLIHFVVHNKNSVRVFVCGVVLRYPLIHYLQPVVCSLPRPKRKWEIKEVNGS
jgi:hypothetical protein